MTGTNDGVQSSGNGERKTLPPTSSWPKGYSYVPGAGGIDPNSRAAMDPDRAASVKRSATPKKTTW